MSAPKLIPALLGGLFIGVLSSLPFVKAGNVCCCLWVVSGGALAAWQMQQNTPRPVTAGEGALVGLLAGLFGTVVWVLWGVVGLLIFSSSPFDMADFQRAMGEAQGMSPEAREALENLSPAVMLVVGSVIWAVVSMVFATGGGLLGAMIFKRKSGGGPSSDVPAPPSAPASPGFTPPSFNPPPAPMAPPPFTPPAPPPPSTPPVDVAPMSPVPMPPAPTAPASALPPASSWPPPADEEYAGDAPTILIPARGPTLPPVKPAPPAAPPPGYTPPPDEPESH
jgi:hypothetical protein